MSSNYPENFLITRNDLLRVDPRELQIDETKYNGRWKPLDDEVVRDLALNMIEVGQQQPIRVRSIVGRGKTRVFTPTLGFNRTRAAIMINNDEELLELARKANRITKEGIFPLDCVVSNVNEQEAFVQNVVENARRRNTTPIDDAHNHEKMRQIGYKDAEIARIVGLSQSRISQLKQLLALENHIQELVHAGEMSVGVAIGLVNLTPDVRDKLLEVSVQTDEGENDYEMINNSTDSNGTMTSVEDMDQDESEETDDSEDETEDSSDMLAMKGMVKPAKKSPPKKSISRAKKKAEVADRIKMAQREQGIAVRRSLKEIRAFFDSSLAPSSNYGVSDASIKHIIESFMKFVNGNLNGDDLINELVDTFEN